MEQIPGRKVAGIHSKQPWFVLNADRFFTHLATGNPIISHYYSFQTGAEPHPVIAIPDGCIDLLFDCDGHHPEGRVCGSTLQATAVDFHPNHRYFGVRFAPGVVPPFLTISATELVGQQPELAEVVRRGRNISDQVIDNPNFSEQVQIINRFVSREITQRPSRLTTQLVQTICQRHGNIQIQELERYSGYCRRTLQRQFHQDIGFTPKVFCRAIRCQSAIYHINHSNNLTFSNLAQDLGFSDQSHFLREFKQLVNVTPMEYQQQVRQQTYLGRIQSW